MIEFVVKIVLGDEEKSLLGKLVHGITHSVVKQETHTVGDVSHTIRTEEKVASTEPKKKAPVKKRKAVKKPEPKPEPEPEPEVDPFDIGDSEPKEYTKEDVRAALTQYATANNKSAAMKLLRDHNATSISDLDKDKYAALIEACS